MVGVFREIRLYRIDRAYLEATICGTQSTAAYHSLCRDVIQTVPLTFTNWAYNALPMIVCTQTQA